MIKTLTELFLNEICLTLLNQKVFLLWKNSKTKSMLPLRPPTKCIHPFIIETETFSCNQSSNGSNQFGQRSGRNCNCPCRECPKRYECGLASTTTASPSSEEFSQKYNTLSYKNKRKERNHVACETTKCCYAPADTLNHGYPPVILTNFTPPVVQQVFQNYAQNLSEFGPLMDVDAYNDLIFKSSKTCNLRKT